MLNGGSNKKYRTFWKRDWVLFERITNPNVFTESFAPYKTSQFNLFTAFFAITLLPYV
nr:YfzA family protein [Bacillus clarus]